MTKLFTVHYDAGYLGTDVTIYNVEAESEEEACELYREEAQEHYESYLQEDEEDGNWYVDEGVEMWAEEQTSFIDAE